MDATLLSILSVLDAVKADAAASGAINVPRSLAALRAEAASRGLAPDAAGVFAVAQHMSVEAAAAERARHESGLGGALRRVVAALPALRNRRTIIEEAEVRPFINPAAQTGAPDALLSRKVNAAVDAMNARVRELSGRPA